LQQSNAMDAGLRPRIINTSNALPFCFLVICLHVWQGLTTVHVLLLLGVARLAGCNGAPKVRGTSLLQCQHINMRSADPVCLDLLAVAESLTTAV
jgi:hypothetical protein